MSTNGLICSTDTNSNPSGSNPFYVRNTDPVVVKNLLADTVITDTLNLDGQTITATSSDILLNGVPVGGGGGGGADWSTYPALQDVNMDGYKINDCAEVASLAGLTLTADTDLAIEAAAGNVSITAASITMKQDVDLDGNDIDNVTKITGDNNLTLSAAGDIIADPLFGAFQVTGRTLTMRAQAPPGELVSNAEIDLTTDNDINIEAGDVIDVSGATINITATTAMTINNELSMATHRITNLSSPIDPLDGVNKNYVDTRPAPPADTLANVLLAGNNAGSSSINMNGQDITGVNDIVMTGSVPTISAPLSATLTVAGLGPTTIASGTITTITAPEYVSIGSAGYTTIENLKITNSVIEKVTGEADLQYKNVSSIEATGQLNVTAAPFCYNSTDLNDKDFNVAGSAQIVANFSKTIGLYTAAGDLTLQVANGDLQLQSGTGNIAVSTAGGNVVENLLSGGNHYIADTTSLPSNAATGILEIQSDTKGIYIPRMTSLQREAIASPQAGLMVFDTTASALYMYGARGWAKVALTNASDELLQSLSGLDGGVRTYSLTGLSEVDTDTIKLNTIQPIAPLVSSDVGVEAQLVWEGDILLKNNGNSAGTDVVIDSIPSAPSTLPDVVAYDPATKKLYYQAGAGPTPTPTLSEVVAAGNNAFGEIKMNGNPITSISQLQMSGSAPTLEPFSSTAELSINSVPTQSLNLYGTVNTFNALNLQGAPLRLNGGGGAAGNLLVSSGGSGAPSWSTGLKYDAVRKVLYAG